MKVSTANIVIGLTSFLLYFSALTSSAQTAPLNLKVNPLGAEIINGPLSLANQGSFFIGGKDIESNTLSTLPAYVLTTK